MPRFDWICEHRAWFDIFYEHVNYFRISDFYRMFGTIIESGSLFGDQYLFIVADLATLREPKRDVKDRVIFPQNFTEKIAERGRVESRDRPRFGVSRVQRGHLRAAQRTGWAAYRTVIDINPAKQGKYLPATGCWFDPH